MQRIYIAGPMSGYPEHNFPAFIAEAKRLRQLGYDVVNPQEINGHLVGKLEYIQYLRNDVAQLATCDTIAFLPGWQGSRGANIELEVATLLQMKMTLCEHIQNEYDGGNVWFDDIEPATVGIIERIRIAAAKLKLW